MSKAGKRIIKALQEVVDSLNGKGPPLIIHNPVAKDLRTPKYKLRVVQDKTKYNRKDKNGIDSTE